MKGEFVKHSEVPVLLQSETAECGLVCLAMVASSYGHKLDVPTLRRKVGGTPRGANLKDIINVASTLKFSARPLKLEVADLSKLQTPAILHWDMRHFVVLVATAHKHVIVHDPVVGRRKYSFDEVGNHFTGVAVELTPTSEFEQHDEVRVTKFGDLFERTRGFYQAAFQILFLSVVVQLLTIAGPFYLQLIVDKAVVRQDADLLLVIALGFVFVAIFRTFATALRSYVAVYLSAQLGFQMAANVFNHLISLPAEYFERRHVGDVVSRFGSITAIRRIVTDDMINVIFDGALAVLTLVVLLLYSVKLTLMLLLFVFAASLFRALTVRTYRVRQQETIIADAKQQSVLMENMRAIQAIKAYCRELQRSILWKNSYAEVVDSGVKLQKFQIGAEWVSTLIFAIENIVILYVAALLVMDGELSVGMLFTYVFMKGNFETSVASFIRRLADIRLIRLQLERLSDITTTPREVETLWLSNFRRTLHGAIEASNVSYSYSSQEKSVLLGLSLKVEPGSLTIIAGASGAGKSTLIRVLAGLLRPTQGEILADGVSIATIGYREYRSQIATVLQSSQLISGSLEENISMFDESPDRERIEAAAKAAMVYDEIVAMPMGFNSLIGDMGSIMSAGQAQRVLVARAIYHQPKIIILDEAMSNLDFNFERQILQNLRQLKVTVIMVTHRRNVYDLADSLYRMDAGSLKEFRIQPELATG